MDMTNFQFSFSGSLSYSIDAKNRLNIPAKFRKMLGPENNDTFVISKGFDTCLYLYPLMEWNKVQAELNSLGSMILRNRDFVRSIQKYTSHSQFDIQGRIQIPDLLLDYAKIKKKVQLVGMINKIEVWNPDLLEEWEASRPKSDDFGDLANNVHF